MSRLQLSWVALAGPAAYVDLPSPEWARSHAGRERAVDALAFVLAVVLGALFVSPELHDNPDPWSATAISVDVIAGALACLSLWWRRRFPVSVAVACTVFGTVSSSATPAGLLALSSLAVHRPARPAVLVTVLWVPSVLVYAAYSPTTGPVSVVALVMPLALAATGWGMFIRARRQLLLSLRERALRAEADQELRQEQARVAERTRIAREMHDVLAHRISLLALHAGGLEVRPDLPAEQVQKTAALLRATARQALEELRSVIGLLRENNGPEPDPLAPQPVLSDIDRLVQERRDAGTHIDLHMDVQARGDVPPAVARDAYRIVQEGLTNAAKHAHGAFVRVHITATAPGRLNVSVRNGRPVRTSTGASLPGAGVGLLGLRERVALAGGILTVGPDSFGDFVVEAELTWRT
ncbi:sensor histidine kinase [Intrasporangium sp.]|uniref:sensor histidine kinase n=1 Tax=Intrasporangium sp. TaxID=1925024 RepID=UPI002D78D119|nr:histidine kinase [Intrasporangium sp.]